MVWAQDRPASAPVSAADPLEVVMRQPLSPQTWPLWREAYTRIYFDDEQDPVQERRFYEQVRAFFRATAAGSGGSLPRELASDPMAWVALATTYLHGADDAGPGGAASARDLTAAEDACRKARALGDPQGIASYSLAVMLIYPGLLQGRDKPLTAEMERRLAEAEERLRHVERISPRAHVDRWRGSIAQLRGDKKKADLLFRKAADEHPKSAQCALAYLMNAFSESNSPAKLTDRTGPFAKRFADDAYIQVLHAAALYRDERFAEAAATLKRARNLDARAVRFLGDEFAKDIDAGRHITPKVANGLIAMKSGQYNSAKAAFRQALDEDPQNFLAARFLARAIVTPLGSMGSATARTFAANAASEIGELCGRFPDDAEMQAGLAVALHVSGRNAEAARALDRVEPLGGRLDQLLDGAAVLAIRHGAESDEATHFWQMIALAVVVAAAIWIAAMFALGAILAVSIPRIPESIGSTGSAQSRREVWLERFYLLVLSLGLVVFYASVPLVALGLLAVTLAVFGFFLVIRILHIGVLHRGLWATWNILRCALLGPSRGVVGIEATAAEHPRLFEASRAVAERLQTRPVDTVYLTPSSNISVKQEGAGPFGLLGKRQRVLEIGISTLPILSCDEFKSILAHEYGHFSHNDTFYGRFIFQVSASLASSLAVMNAAGGVLNYINPFYWFWWLYLRAYTLLSTGFSRSREFLADRRAALAYGKQAFVSGLTKVSVDGVLFDSTVYPSVRSLLSQGRAYANAFDVFRHVREQTEMVTSRERLLEEMRQTKPKWFDSHPTFSERLAAVADFPDVAPPGETDPAIDLLSDPRGLEAELTNILTSYMSQVESGA